MDSSKLKDGMLIGFFISLLLYHISTLIKNQIITPVNNIYDLFSLAQLAVTIVVFLFVVSNKFIARLLYRDNYIGGKYEGKSTYRKPTETAPEDIERFTITQNLFDTSISGKSIKSDGSLASLWTGRLFKVDGQVYYFAVELSVSSGEVGILKLIFDKNDLDGFYYSQTKPTYSFRAKRLKEQTFDVLKNIFTS